MLEKSAKSVAKNCAVEEKHVTNFKDFVENP